MPSSPGEDATMTTIPESQGAAAATAAAVVPGLTADGRGDPFEAIIEAKKRSLGVELDTQLPPRALRELVVEFKYEIWKRQQVRFPEDPWEQLWGAAGALFGSWENPRAVTYRRL